MKKATSKTKNKYPKLLIPLLAIFVVFVFSASAYFDYSLTLNNSVGVSNLAAADEPESDPSKEGFKLVVCDGPTLKGKLLDDANAALKTRKYVPCDFIGLMSQIQHLINIMIIVGVLAAIVGFTYAGALYITGSEANIKKAKGIFPKVFGGFIIMLSAWFIVYQILSWLTGEGSGFTQLLVK